MTSTYMEERAAGKRPFAAVFHPYQIEINDRVYFVDFTSLPNGSFEDNPDLTFDELMSG
jgi:hypothetical protein